MSDRRLTSHPVLVPLGPGTVPFTFNGQPLLARPGEMISTALMANGISVFGNHHKDGGAQGLFCANGQCSQCRIVADDILVKSCMTAVAPQMRVTSAGADVPLPIDDRPGVFTPPDDVSVPVLILGAGPAGLSAAIELADAGFRVLIVDDKPSAGGKLTLQTHGFFGSAKECWAGVRGTDIGAILAAEIARRSNIELWTSSTAIGIFNDGKVGVITPTGYRLVTPEHILVAMGAREKALSFPGSDLPGIYGAGAFQTLVNRDGVKAADRLFILGGGNVGLIGAYHALQAGIDVVGLVEALPRCGGYKVHQDKLKRLGVPIWTRHTVLAAHGKETLEQVTVCRIDDQFQPIAGTERTFAVDTLLIAVGLSPVDEILVKARALGVSVFAAGDANEVAEASAAIFSGRIEGRRLAGKLGVEMDIPAEWTTLGEILKSRPGKVSPFLPVNATGNVYPLIRCVEEIPCNPCSVVCPENLIEMTPSIMDLPRYKGGCIGCAGCVSVCPGLAIVLVNEDYDPTGEFVLLTVPFEFGDDRIPLGDTVETVDFDGNRIGTSRVIAVRERPDQDRRRLVGLEVPYALRHSVAGFRIREESTPLSADKAQDLTDPVVCRCERVRKSEIVAEIRSGVRDMNQLKALSRASMGGCGGKTCGELVMRIFREEGVVRDEVTPGTIRPLIAEVPLGAFIEKKDKARG